MAITVPVHNQAPIRSSGPGAANPLADRWTLSGTSPCCTCACTCDGRVDR